MRRKILVSYGLVVVLFAVTVMQIAGIIGSHRVAAVGQLQGNRTVTVATVRGTIYDRNLKPLVNDENRYYAALLPQQKLLAAIKDSVSESQYELLLDKARDRSPLSVQLNGPAAITDGLHLFHVPIRYGEYCPCPHLLGYLDGSGTNGVCGIEQTYNDVLSRHTGTIFVTYSVDGAGNTMENTEETVVNTVENSVGGVALTIDRDIQEVVDMVAAQYLKKGAVVVLDATSGEILAYGSYPTFRPDEVANALENNDGALVDRVISLYDCGSVFKIVTSIAALENGIPVERCYNCAGEMSVDDTVFHCHNRSGHGVLNMSMAFAESCNLYYIQLAQEIGAEALMDTIDKLGFTQGIYLTDSLAAPASVLPEYEDLTAAAALANLSFGQGKLLITPLQAARLTATITANGTLPTVTAVRGLVKNDGQMELLEKRGGETVISAETVARLRSMMERVVREGTGIRAQSPYTSSAGKTGTAETGQVAENGTPVVQSWFTGYFPADDPQYVVTVLAEDAQNNGGDTAKVFCEISNNLM